MDDDEDEEEENVDEGVEDSNASASAAPPEDVAMIPLMVVPNPLYTPTTKRNIKLFMKTNIIMLIIYICINIIILPVSF